MRTYVPTLDEFRSKARAGNLVPVYTEILGDLETPVSAFRKLDNGDHAFLLESVEGGEKWGRYSFLGTEPLALIKSEGRRFIVEDESGRRTRTVTDPIQGLQEFLAGYRAVEVDGLPRFTGGAVGYFGYDCVRFLEERVRIADWRPGDLPDAQFLITGTLLIFDNLAHTIKIVVNVPVGRDPAAGYRKAIQRIDQLVERLRGGAPVSRPRRRAGARPLYTSTTSRGEYERSVKRAREFILAGDAFQIVLAHELSTTLSSDPFDVYRALRRLNPSPYMYFLRCGGDVILGASPEALVRKEDDAVEVRPIAGTRARGGDRVEDLRLEEELRASDKDRAEHVMLVDLGRNDLGRIAEYGSVTTEELMAVERYSHVMHLVSAVRGTARPQVDAFDVLRACFPAGTVSGAPKVRAMQIIQELERRRRNVYAGGVGYVSFTGNMDLCIAIRTVLCRNGRAAIGVGAGIVADSNPRLEYDETRHKAQVLMDAIDAAEAGLE